jgi:hypothetical protein
VRLAPFVDCDTASYRAVLALSVVTFAAFVVAAPLACSWALWSGSGRLAEAGGFLLQPLRASWWRALWGGPVAYGRKLLFALLVGGAQPESFAQTLPMLIFTFLLILLLLQVRVARSRLPS